MKWISFLRKYGPVPGNDNMYDEVIRRSARYHKLNPIIFSHPQHTTVLNCFAETASPASVILTGTAGDGKTYLCGLVWKTLGGDEREWNSNANYYRIHQSFAGQKVPIHVIRDLTAFGPGDEEKMGMTKVDMLQMFAHSLFHPETEDIFLIAGNDGQIVEALRHAPDSEEIVRARQVFETLLVENRQRLEDVRVTLFNLSRNASVALFDQALQAFLSHEAWQTCYDTNPSEQDFFGPRCPVRHNYELLQQPLVQKRLRALFELCDYNDLHVPIRQILLLLTNAVLGHPGCKDHLMTAADVPKIIRKGTVSQASLYANVFGANLSESRRSAIPIFEYLNRFRIGYETTNRIDNVLIYGADDTELRAEFDLLLGADSFYGADESYKAAQKEYVEGTDESEQSGQRFLQQLIRQRQGLFFKIPADQEAEFGLWDLTVFRYAGEYLEHIVKVLQVGRKVEHRLLARLVRGLNRIFVGMLVAHEHDVILATGFSSSDDRVCRVLEAEIALSHPLGEKVEIAWHEGMPILRVVLAPAVERSLELHLVRYEFLSRVAEGALPGSFSRECYEDILAFKSQLLTALRERSQGQPEDNTGQFVFQILSLDDRGVPSTETVEIHHAT
jgi:hypothetical protein